MSSPSRRDVRNIALWMINLPALAFWPFVSAFPIFSLLNGPASITLICVQALFLATGFWSLLAGALIYKTLRTDGARGGQGKSPQPTGPPKRRGLLIACYATLWTVAYLVATRVITT
jgi:hypothetical protein